MKKRITDLLVVDYRHFNIEYRPSIYRLEFPVRGDKPSFNCLEMAFSRSALVVLKWVADCFTAKDQAASITFRPKTDELSEVMVGLSIDEFPVVNLLRDKENPFNLARVAERKIKYMNLEIESSKEVAHRQWVFDQFLLGAEMVLKCVGFDPEGKEYLEEPTIINLPAVVQAKSLAPIIINSHWALA